MNKIVEKIWNETATEDTSWEGQLAFLEAFAKQIVGETVLTILATDTRDLVYTTHDKGLRDGVVSKIVDSVRNHWSFV